MGKKKKTVKMSVKKILHNRKAKAGLGVGSIGVGFNLLNLGLSMTGVINAPIGWTLTGVGTFGMIVGIFLFLSGKSSVYRESLINEKGAEIQKIPDTLTAMFQRIREIRAEQAKKSMDIQTAKRIQLKMEDINPNPWWVKKMTHYLLKANEPKVFEKWVGVMHLIFVGNAYAHKYENHICNMGGVLETEGYGLREVMANDKEYKSLSEKLERQYAGIPDKICKPILRYENYLYGFSSVILWDDYRKAHLRSPLPNAVEAKITRYSHLEKEVMSKLEGDISKAIDRYMR